MSSEFDVKPEQIDWEYISDVKADVSEVPIWIPEEETLAWIDVYAGKFNKTDCVSGATKTWEMGEIIGSYALTDNPKQVIVALQSGMYVLRLDDGSREELFDAPYDPAEFRFNDGRCDQDGRFWVGSMALRASGSPVEMIGELRGTASFWCIEGTTMRHAIDGVTVANGIAFSPSGTTLYLADWPSWSILAFDVDRESGVASNRRTFTSIPEGMVPDGASVDAEGGYWLALFRAGLIARFSPSGKLDRLLSAPASQPTMVAFGGRGLETMYVTTARRYLDQEAALEQPLAGGIFRCDVGAAGIPEPRYQGAVVPPE